MARGRENGYPGCAGKNSVSVSYSSSRPAPRRREMGFETTSLLGRGPLLSPTAVLDRRPRRAKWVSKLYQFSGADFHFLSRYPVEISRGGSQVEAYFLASARIHRIQKC